MYDVWPSAGLVRYIYIFGGTCSLMEFCQVQNSLCIQVLLFSILAALLHGTRAVGISQTLHRGNCTRSTFSQFPQYSVEGAICVWRAAITLGIRPHSSFFLFYFILGIVPSPHQWINVEDQDVIWHASTQEGAFLGQYKTAAHVGVISPKNATKGGMNWYFSSHIRRKYWNMLIIKITASIPAKFHTAIKTTKYFLCVVQARTNRRWRTAPLHRAAVKILTV